MSWRARFGLPLIIGHRGASARVTENTVESFVAAVEDGADGIELDVQRCASGEIVVFHDRDLSRLLSDPRRLTQVSLSELRALRLKTGEQVPTLDDVLETMPDGFRVNVELKSPGFLESTRLVAGVCKVLERHSRIDVLCSSFDPTALWILSQKAPAVARGFLFHDEQNLVFRRGWPARVVGACAVHPQATLCDAERVRTWRRRNYAIHVWTVDDPAEARRLCNLGVDSIITNQPKALRAALRAATSAS